MRQPNFDKLSVKELESMLNPSAVIPTVKLAIDLETNLLNVNTILCNERGYLENEYRVTQLKLLLSFLRRRGRL
jgi:hypothetical protein